MFKIKIIIIFHVHFDMGSAVGTSQRGKYDNTNFVRRWNKRWVKVGDQYLKMNEIIMIEIEECALFIS